MKTARDLNNATYEAIRTIRETAQSCARIVMGHRARQTEISKDRHLSEERKAELAAEARKAALGQLGEVGGKVATAKETVAAALRAARQPDGSVEEQLLDEQRLGRAWERARAQLDAGMSPSQVAAIAETEGDELVVRAILRELPARMRAQGVDQDGIAAELQLLRLSAGESLPELERKADEVAAELEQAAYFAEWNLAEVRGELEGTSEAMHLPSSTTELLDVRR